MQCFTYELTSKAKLSVSNVGLPDHWKFFQGQFLFQRVMLSCFDGLPQGKSIAAWRVFGGNATIFLCLANFVLSLKVLLKLIIIKNLSPLKISFSPPNLKTWLRACRGDWNGHLSHPWILGLRTKNILKIWSQHLDSD